MKKGSKMSSEARKKMSKAKKGKPTWASTHKKEVSKIMKGNKHALGNKPTQKQLEGLKKGHGWNKGKKTPEKTLIKMRASHQGKRPWASGENCPSWKGGVTPINKLVRFNLDARSWRQKIFERDKFLCQMPGCNQQERFLNAHHIKKFIDYPELRLEINNGITLCKNCHNKTKKNEEKLENMFMEIIKSKKTTAAD